MYSILPSIVAILFLIYGLYVIAQKGINRVTFSFFILCVTTFFWQATWAVLFQINNPDLAGYIVKFGYALIIFLPTSLYHFLVEISNSKYEKYWLAVSYTFAFFLVITLITSDKFIAGYYQYYFGYYPKAGVLHSLHILQTIIVINRGLYLTYAQQKNTTIDNQKRLRLCIFSVFIYFIAAVDYLCNYGFEFYPPGVLFTSASLGLIAYAVVKYDLMNPVIIASSVAHEMRTPLSTIRLQAEYLERVLPELLHGYDLAVKNGLCTDKINNQMLVKLKSLSGKICHQIDRSDIIIDMLLAAGKMEHKIDPRTFGVHSIAECISEALDTYPFSGIDKEKVDTQEVCDFKFFGSNNLLIFVLFNLIKNALFAIQIANKGNIQISTELGKKYNKLIFTDYGSGIPPNVLPRIFDRFFSANKIGGTGIGLAFCKSVMLASEGHIQCQSELGKYTTFIMEFPSLASNDSFNVQ